MKYPFIPPPGEGHNTIHLVSDGPPDARDKPHSDPSEPSGVDFLGISRRVTDLVLMDEGYVTIEYLDDGDGPLLDDD